MRDRAYGNNLYVLFSLPLFKKWLKNYWHFVTGPTKLFQLTSSRGGWQSHLRMDFSNTHFNSHPHKEDDVCYGDWWQSVHNFNSHPHEEDDDWWADQQEPGQNFNSHPHKEDDSPAIFARFWMSCISTHILTRRMTFPQFSWSAISSFQLTSSQGGWLLWC